MESSSPPSSLSLVWQPESEAEVAGGEGTSGGTVKRGLSLESAAAGQDVKRFRTATGAASTVSSIHHHPAASRMWLSVSMPRHLTLAWLDSSSLCVLYFTPSKINRWSSYLQSSFWLSPCSTPLWIIAGQLEKQPFLHLSVTTGDDSSVDVVVLIHCSLQQYCSLTSVSSWIPLWYVGFAVSKLDEMPWLQEVPVQNLSWWNVLWSTFEICKN